MPAPKRQRFFDSLGNEVKPVPEGEEPPADFPVGLVDEFGYDYCPHGFEVCEMCFVDNRISNVLTMWGCMGSGPEDKRVMAYLQEYQLRM